jgi:Cu2+-exporting ATPase
MSWAKGNGVVSDESVSPRRSVAASGLPHLRALLSRYHIVHAVPGRIRLRPFPAEGDAARLEPENLTPFLTKAFPGADIRISSHTGSVLILYGAAAASSGVSPAAKTKAAASRLPERVGPRNPLPGKVRSFFYPRAAVFAMAVLRAVPYIFTAVKALLRGRLNLDVLDGAALLVCLLQRDFRSLSSITFFFALGEFLADWTRKKSRASLVESLSLNIHHVWIREGEGERQIPFAELRTGDEVVVRAGFALPVDGTILEGQGMVNQASMTGESLPVHRGPGSSVYAGTILEEGEIVVAASRVGSNTRIHSILRTIEESESVKATIQGRYERIADAIVPYNFLLSGAVYAATRDPLRAGSVLLVDYSCAIRLATPLSIFTGMREAAERGVLIKGGKFMEAVAEADVIVFDKTGTLTKAKPTLVDVIPFGNRKRSTVLRLAACLEEHFVHPVGQAVVRASDAEGLKHREEHTTMEFLVAHGIASNWRGQRVLVGSGHFVLEDEGIPLTPEQQEIIETEAKKGRSILYLSIGGELAGLLLIEDEIRADTAKIVQDLREDGVKRVIMLTGDSELTAGSVAAWAGITEHQAQMLPEEKAAFVKSLKQAGHIVAMVGDGINDSPALSAANVGIAMAEGADMAREIADIVLVNGELSGLLLARRVSRSALHRVRASFQTSLFWNSIFLIGGLLGILRPGLSALLHNATTAAIAVSSVRPMLSPLDDWRQRPMGHGE